MAAVATGGADRGICWMNGVSDEEQPLVFVPGVEGEVKARGTEKGPKMQARHNWDFRRTSTVKNGGGRKTNSGLNTKTKVPSHPVASATIEPSLAPASGPLPTSTQGISETTSAKSLVCLKDLCPEDKRRIANLIEELARMSEEKEESVQRLKDEQENFERKFQQMEQENQLIAQERESLQQQYKECQELLGLYQEYLSQQQAKLNQSITQLIREPDHGNMVLSGEEAPSRTSTSRANGSQFDGSYLSLAPGRARQTQMQSRGGRREAVQTFSYPPSLSSVSELSDGPQKSQKRDPHSESSNRCGHCQGRAQDTSLGTQKCRIHNGCCLESCQCDTFNQHGCERLHTGNTAGSEANEALTRPLLGHKVWEEKRHQLLLQKMQLEIERERLQARLAEQEERLNRQNQQLCQSRLDYSRCQQAAQSDLNSANDRNCDSVPECSHHQGLPTSVCEDAEGHPAGQSLHDKHSRRVAAPLEKGNEALEPTRKDMATSPTRSPAQTPPSLKDPTSVSVIQKILEPGLDFSLVELLDIFTPISGPQQNKPSTQRPKTSHHGPALTTPRPVDRSLHTPARAHLWHTQQALEESQILEDIFFIC